MKISFCKTLLVAMIVVAAVVARPARCGEVKLNALNQQEVAAGWILLFDGETSFGWKTTGDVASRVVNGELVLSGGQGFFTTTTAFPNYNLKADVWISADANSGVFLRGSGDSFDSTNSYEVNVNDMNSEWPTGSIYGLAKPTSPVKAAGKWTTVEITANGSKLTAKMDGKLTAEATDMQFKNGTVALQYDGAGVVKYRNIKLQPLNLESIFNGKNLEGWKEVPDHKSVYTVTPEGWMNVNNGNGDIQTEREWGDFVLQIDVISNGDHLNSGVFFRAIKGQFWSGYECQIRNQWQGDDRTKAVDYGTGGLYNRQPARKVVSSDREWFTVTQVAHGLHMASWVNGYQVTDFTDMRLPAESARNGSRTKAGCLSLQGHDPTTDLSFRNIKVREMPG